MHLERVRRGLRRLLAPELVDQPLGGDRLAGRKRERRQERARLAARNGDDVAVLHDLERPEDPKLHRFRVVTRIRPYAHLEERRSASSAGRDT